MRAEATRIAIDYPNPASTSAPHYPRLAIVNRGILARDRTCVLKMVG
ncbi:MAG TPA: hypothetical protein VKP30_31520 [Polyangiaceae bacterium]|nr:hypothetical protein [Polyangiaceae bacterium]